MPKISFEATLKSKNISDKETKDTHKIEGTMVFETDISEKITVVGDEGLLKGFNIDKKYTWTIDNPQTTLTEIKEPVEVTIKKADKIAEKIMTPPAGMPRIGDKKRELAAKKNEEVEASKPKKSKGGMNYLVH